MTPIRKLWASLSLAIAGIMLYAPAAFAATGVADNAFSTKKFLALAIGWGLAFAAGLGALGQGKAASAALEGMARNPGAGGRLFTTVILAMALIESLVIYSLVISIMLLGKIGEL